MKNPIIPLNSTPVNNSASRNRPVRQKRKIYRKKGEQCKAGQKVFLKSSNLSGIFQSGSDSMFGNSVASSCKPADQSGNSKSDCPSDLFQTGSGMFTQSMNISGLDTAPNSETSKSFNSSFLYESTIAEGFGRAPHLETALKKFTQSVINKSIVQQTEGGEFGNQIPKDLQNILINSSEDTGNPKDQQHVRTNSPEDTEKPKNQQTIHTKIIVEETQISRNLQNNVTSILVGSHNPKDQQNKQTSQLETSNSIVKTEEKGKFPELIIFRGYQKNYAGIQFLKKSFDHSPYGPLQVKVTGSGNSPKTVTISCNGECLVETHAETKQFAEGAAVVMLYKQLRKTNYEIKAKHTYIPKNRFPQHVISYDSSNSHIFKVVCLKKPGGPSFPHPLYGDIDYVTSENDLWKYLEDYAKSQSKADLFVLNIEKKQRKLATGICIKNGMWANVLNNCSNRAVVARRQRNLREIMEELKACGGENIKYTLIPPGSKIEDEAINDEDIHVKDEISDNQQQNTVAQNIPKPPGSMPKQDIQISQWIIDNLIIMEYFDDWGNLETSYVLLYQSVRDCSRLEEFIVEKSFNSLTREITGCALIDRNLVGKAKGFNEKLVKQSAAENALQNLRSCCFYIQVKKAYYALNDPGFRLRKENKRNNLYRIVKPEAVIDEQALDKLLFQFGHSRFEDLFFLEDIPEKMRTLAFNKAKFARLQVRYCGTNCVCVSNKRRPLNVFKDLMSKNKQESVKYKLIKPTPMPKLNQHQALFENNKNQNLQGPLNHTYIQPSQEPCSTSSQSVPSHQLDRRVSDNEVSGDRIQNDQSESSGLGQGVEQPSGYRRDDKRSYNEGPGSKEGGEPYSRDSMQQPWKKERRSDQQSESWREKGLNIDKTFDRCLDFDRSNQGVDQTSYEYNNRSYDYGDDHWQERRPYKLQTEHPKDKQYYGQKASARRENEPGSSNYSDRVGDRREDSLFSRRRNYLSFEGEESKLFSRRPDYLESTNLSSPNMESQKTRDQSYRRDDDQYYENRPGNRDNRYSDFSEIDRQTEQNWNRRETDQACHREPIERIQSQTTSAQSQQSRRDAAPRHQTNQLWNKGIKQVYDQRPVQATQNRIDFSHLFHGISPEDTSEPPSLNSRIAKQKEKRRGHSFSKIARYANKP